MVRQLNKTGILATAMTVLLLSLGYKTLYAQQVATHILDDVLIERTDYNAIIKVLFKQPFRYISHNPTSTGNTINIKLNIINPQLSQIDQPVNNESISLIDNKGTGLNEVVYEKNGRNSEFVIFYFDKTNSFEVIQGSDPRSLTIVIFGLE